MKVLTFLFLTFFYLLASAQDFALKQLENSPRHNEWVNVKSGEREVNCFVAYPEVSEKATVIIVIHENRGMTDWVRSFADQLAAEGYIAVAPDLLSDFSAEYRKTSDFATSDDARNAIYQLDNNVVQADLNATQQYASGIPSGNGKTVAIGFCWGGSQSFRFANYNNQLKAALVFYGSAPENRDEIEMISSPVYGFYGGNDARINAGIPDTEKAMKEAGKTYEYEIYDGAGHAYMRQGDDPSGSVENKNARDQSWERIKAILAGL